MGDRGNIRVIQDKGELYFYTHWTGYELPQILAAALDRGRDRWSDAPYLSRIIFSEMIHNYVLENTGFGISVSREDYNYDDIIVNMNDLTVTDRRGVTRMFDDYVDDWKAGTLETAEF